MKPPKKIVLTHYDLQWLSETHQRFDPCSQRYEETFVGNTFEYHLATVWHDAVKDPPKEPGVYDIGWIEQPDIWEQGYWNGNRWEGKDWKRPLRRQPTHYLAVPKIITRKGDLK